jgi:hypothetical protein
LMAPSFPRIARPEDPAIVGSIFPIVELCRGAT